MYTNFQQPQQQQIAPIFDPRSINVSPQNLPHIPQLQVKWQDTLQFVQMIAVYVANISARHALNNPARTYVFNKIFENNLSNVYFFGIIVTIADFVGLGIVKQQVNQGNLTAAIESNTENVLAVFTAMAILNEHFLTSNATPETINNAKNSLMMFQRQVDEIRYLNIQQPQQYQNHGYGGQQPYNPGNNFGNNDGFTNRSFGGSNQQPGNFINNPGQNSFTGAGGSVDRTFVTNSGNSGNNAPAFVNPQNGVTSQWDSTSMPSPAFDNRPTFVKMPEEQVQTELIQKEADKLVWKPSILQPHQIAYDPLIKRVKLIKRVLDGEEIIVEQLENLTEEEMEMEWNKHKLEMSPTIGAVRTQVEVDMYKIPSVEEVKGSHIENEHRVQVVDNLEGRNRAELNDDFLVRAGVSKKPFEDKDDGNIIWREASFVNDAILGVKIHHAQMKDAKSLMRRERFVVPKVFVCKHDIKRIAENAFKEQNFLVTAVRLKEFINRETVTLEQKQSIAELDRYLASLVNIFICDYLSITSLWIDSFIGDIPPLFDGYIEEQYGPLVFEKFKENQHRIYKSYLSICNDDEIINNAVENYGIVGNDQYDVESGEVSYLVFEQNYTVTSVRLTSDETRLDATTSPTSKIIDGLYPAMVEYCRILFEDKENSNTDWAGHLMVTSNGKVYNFMESPILKKTYLAKEFNTIHLMA
jgi:hypothetical protein